MPVLSHPGVPAAPIHERTVYERAVDVLHKNVVSLAMDNGKGKQPYRHTMPSPQFYVHQWLWDSCMHAMALVHVDRARAYDELRSLIAGQWSNGNIGAITYNPQETSYYSKAENWHTDAFARGTIKTTGITQPPLLATAVEYVYRHSPRDAAANSFLTDLLPAVCRYHHFLHRYRDPERSHLLTVIHPWESGLDNSPRWDSLLSRINVADIPQSIKDDVDQNRSDSTVGDATHRPSQDEYYKYMWLVHVGNEHRWDFDALVPSSPFAIKDVLFNSLWIKANDALSTLLHSLDQDEGPYQEWADASRAALGELWRDEHRQHCDLDVTQGRSDVVVQSTVAIFAPLWSGAVNGKQLDALLDRLVDTNEFWTDYPVPSTALNSTTFQLVKYWRGPTWPITNMFVIEGLRRYAKVSARAAALAEDLSLRTLAMIEEHGFFEYYNPATGDEIAEARAALGFGSFSWSAAVYIYLAHRAEE